MHKSIVLISALCFLLSVPFLRAAQTQILLSAPAVFPGETLRVEADGIAPHEKTRMSFANGIYPLFPTGPDGQRGLIGIRLGAAPGKYPLRLQRYVKRLGKWQTLSEESVEISSKTYPIEHINFDPEKSALFKWEHQESARIHKLLLAASGDQFWEGLFDFPVQGPIIGEFGIKRVRNGNIDAGFHKGYDLKGAAGTPILAPAGGVVMMASTLKAHGKTILLNHGQGVMTIYLHLKSMAVTPGKKVRKGQKIGLVGSSGLSTAPHVHWGLYVHGVPVDAKIWTEKEF